MYRLIKPLLEHKKDATLYIEELLSYKSAIHGTGFLDKYLESSSYEEWLSEIEILENNSDDDKVSCSTYFLVDGFNNIIGMTNIRHTLNDKLFFHGGHIGYSIRPLERGKGYGKLILSLALLKCRELGIDKVLITAEDNNVPSYKTIEALGGILENKINDKGKVFRRYFINLED